MTSCPEGIMDVLVTIAAGISKQLSRLADQQALVLERLADVLDRMDKPGYIKFDGKEPKVSAWVDAMEVLAQARGEELQVENVVGYLRGRALTWYMGHVKVHGPATTWDEFAKLLVQMFGELEDNSINFAKKKLYSLVHDGDLNEHIYRFQEALAKAPPMRTESQIYAFVQGLSADCQRTLVDHYPKTLLEAFEAARAYDIRRRLPRRRTNCSPDGLSNEDCQLHVGI